MNNCAWRRVGWCATACGFAVMVAVVGPLLRDSAKRNALLHLMLDGGSYTLRNDPSTRAQLEAILPELVTTHHQAVAQCGTAKMADLSRMEAFNRRITAWRAILNATGITANTNARSYIAGFITSKAALPEEVKSGRVALKK